MEQKVGSNGISSGKYRAIGLRRRRHVRWRLPKPRPPGERACQVAGSLVTAHWANARAIIKIPQNPTRDIVAPP